MRAMKRFEFALKEARIPHQIMKLIYCDEDYYERVCYVLATNHPDSDMSDRIRMLNQRMFEIKKTRNLMRLSTRLYGREEREFEKWEDFFDLYGRCYPEQTQRIKPIVLSRNRARN